MSTPRDERLARVDDYTSGVMPDDEAARFEEELFAAAADGHEEVAEALVFTQRLATGMAWLEGRPGFSVHPTREAFDRWCASVGDVFRFDIPASGETRVPEWPASTKIVYYRVDVDLRGFDAADVVVTSEAGEPVKTFRDVQWDPSDGALYAVCEEPLARLSFRERPFVARVEGVKQGKRETVAEIFLRPG